MIGIKQINDAVRQGDIAKANELADSYLKNTNTPKSTRLYLHSASWRSLPHQSAPRHESHNTHTFQTNLHVVAGPFNTHSDLIHGLKRLSFYIAPFVSKIIIASNHKLPNTLPKDKEIDQSVPSTYARAKKNGVFQRSSKSLSRLLSDLPSSEKVVILDFSENRELISLSNKHATHLDFQAYGVSTSSRNEGSLFIQCLYDYMCKANVHSTETRNAQSHRLLDFVNDNRSDEIALVCNGPSVSELSISNPLTTKPKAILCNTAFLNQDFKKYFDTIAIVFADPIFHYGISSYSATFRESVIAEASNPPNSLTIIIPEKYAHILYHYMPSLAANSIAVPHEKMAQFNHDLTTHFTAKTTANILTFLMLPLGSTLAKTIYLFGADGRPRSEDSYFWSHDKKSQLSDEKMANIRIVHPSFFSIDYNDYYDEHVSICNDYSLELEKAGYKLYACTKTHIDAFGCRMHPGFTASSVPSKKIYVSINPDAGKNPGHYISHENILNREFISNGYQHIVLCHAHADIARSVGFKSIPTFSCPGSWMLKVDRMKNDFQKEFRTSFLQIASDSGLDAQIVVYMYLGCTKVAAWICESMASMPLQATARTQIYINCFNNIVNPKPDEIREELALLESSPHGRTIHLSIDSASAKQDMLSILHQVGAKKSFGVWPMISTTDYNIIHSSLPDATGSKSGSLTRIQNRKYAVYFPATSQRAKGIHIGLDLCLTLSSAHPNKKYAIRKSSHDIDDEISSKYLEAAQRPNIDIILSGNSDVEYLSPFQSAEISCITYDPAFFASKTSAVLVDSVASGCKIVCCKDTWLAQELFSSNLNAYSLSKYYTVDSYLSAIEIAYNLEMDSCEAISEFLYRYSAVSLFNYLSSHSTIPYASF